MIARAVLAAVLVLLMGCTAAERPQATSAPTPVPATAPAEQERWDPRKVDDLPAAADEVATALPDQVDPPDNAPLLATKPMAAAVLSVDRRGGRIQLLGLDGTWRELQVPSPHGRLALSRAELSPDGTRLAALLDDGVELWHLPTGTRRTLPLPAGFEPWDFSWLSWVDDDSLLLDDLRGGWRIDTLSGAADRTPYPTGMSFGWTVDDRGAVVEVNDPSEDDDVLSDWGDGMRHRVDMAPTGRLSSLQVEEETVVGTSFDRRGNFGVYVAERSDLTPRHVLPVRDYEANYSNWALRTVGILDDGSVLLWVAVPSRRSEVDGWRIVRWDPAGDRLEVVTRSEGDPTQPVTFAMGLLDEPWDPREVDALPAADPGVAPLLPEVLRVPTSSPALASHPTGRAVLTVLGKRELHLLGVDGSWRSVPLPERGSGADLTDDGTRMAVQQDGGVEVWDLATGGRTWVADPPRHRPWEYTSWGWLDHETLLLDDLGGGWQVDVATGRSERVPYPSGMSFWWTVDPDGAVVESADWARPNLLTDWATGEARRVSMEPTGRLMWVQAEGDTVVGASYDNAPFAVYVADRSDLTPRHVLRLGDHDANYSNGGLSVVGILDDGTVLLRVAVFRGRGMPWRLVAWEPQTDELAIVTRTEGTVGLLDFADDLLG